MRRILGDSQTRAKLDAVEQAMFHPMFADLVAELDQCGGLDAMRCLHGHLLIPLDGTEFHGSDKIHCANCSHRKRGKDKAEYFHTLLAARWWRQDKIVSCRWTRSSLSPRTDMTSRTGERAARRWLAAHGAKYARFGPICLS